MQGKSVKSLALQARLGPQARLAPARLTAVAPVQSLNQSSSHMQRGHACRPVEQGKNQSINQFYIHDPSPPCEQMVQQSKSPVNSVDSTHMHMSVITNHRWHHELLQASTVMSLTCAVSCGNLSCSAKQVRSAQAQNEQLESAGAKCHLWQKSS